MADISKHLTLAQMTASDTAKRYGIQNIPDDKALQNLMEWGENIYDPLVEQFGKIFVSSGYRNSRVNSLVGGSPTSSHVYGQAGDLDGDAPSSAWQNIPNAAIMQWAMDNLEYDQIIAEYEQNGRPRWIHIGYRKGNNRKQAMIAVRRADRRTAYLPYSNRLFYQIYDAVPRPKDLERGYVYEEELSDMDHETCHNEYESGLEYNGNRAAGLIIPAVEAPPIDLIIPSHVEENPVMRVVDFGEYELALTLRKKHT